MRQKRQRHCDEWRSFRDSAVAEWCRAETFEQVCTAWGRFGGRVTLHRYGRDHYRELGRRSALARRFETGG